MKLFYALLFTAVLASSMQADSITLKNGDHLTGTITDADGKQITLKTDSAGDVKVAWSSVAELSSDKPLYVVTPEKTTINGTLTVSGTDLVVHTSANGDVHVAVAQVTVVRSADEQQAYEKSLHPAFLADWKGGVNVGFALARGNSDTTNLSTAFTADRKTLSDEIKAYASSIYTTNGATTTGGTGGVTADAILGGIRYDRNLTKRVFAFGSGDFTHDVLQHLDLQQIYTGGLGWHAIDRPNTTFDLLAGVNYTRANYSSGAATAGLSQSLPGLTVGEDFMHKFGASTTLTEDFTFYPDLSDINQYRFSLDASVITKLNKWLGWQSTITDRYITNPPVLGTKSNDFILSTGLNIAFSD